ncbi:MAG: glycosyltransferase family 4 protein [Cyclobacteriaceae bacterium]|nr:glycosyltransferase family 4 protein [Cyclobacteriaceae bacterium]UYN85600.1 MAG: glycosyltransferase family 4 protein [Cyclobacteriaceae bacterium]
MRILTVGNSFPTAKQNFVHYKIEGLAARGHTVINLAFGLIDRKALQAWKKDHPGYKLSCYSTASFALFKFAFFLAVQFFRNPVRVIRLWRVIQKAGYPLYVRYINFRNNLVMLSLADKVEVVHFEWNNQAVSFCESFSLLKIPFVVSVRGRGVTSQPLVDHKLASRLPQVFEKATIIHSLGNDLVPYIKRYAPGTEKIRIVTPAVNLSGIPCKTNYESGTIRILTVADLVWKKNLITALISFHQLHRQFTNLEYWIIGDGPLKEALLFMRSELKLDDKVKLTGILPHAQVMQHMAFCDIFLMPSLQEGFCNAVIEAQAAGLPVVVTDADGLGENIAPGETGLLVSRWDQPALVEALRLLIMDNELRQRMGKQGVKRAATLYDIQNQLEKFEAIYGEAIRFKR